jgi:hypothetical protein
MPKWPRTRQTLMPKWPRTDPYAKMAVIMSALTRVAAGDAPGTAPDGRGRTNQRYTAESKKMTLQWLLQNSSDPYTTHEELELLRQETGIDTTKRMSTLVTQISSKEMEKDKQGKRCKHVMPKPASVATSVPGLRRTSLTGYE